MQPLFSRIAIFFGFSKDRLVEPVLRVESPTTHHESLSPAAKTKASSAQSLDHDIRLRFYGVVMGFTTEHHSRANPLEREVIERAADKLRAKEFRATAVPRLPAVVPQLFKSIRDPNASANDLVEIIERDPVIAGAVLKMVNSAYYNPTGTSIDSFHRAVVMLGLTGMRTLLSSALLQPIIQFQSVYFKSSGALLWEHSNCCALTCQLLSKTGTIDPFKAYLTGLIHDMGMITLLTQLSHDYRNVFGNKYPPIDSFVTMLEQNCAGLSLCIAQDWGFPEDIVQALKEQRSIDSQHPQSELGRTLLKANHLCEAYALFKRGKLDAEQKADIFTRLQAPSGLTEQLDQLTSGAV